MPFPAALSAFEEVELFAELANHAPHSDEWMRLRNEIVCGFLRLVAYYAKRIAPERDWDEKFSDGYMAVFKAIDCFGRRRNRDAPFPAYVRKYIKMSILTGVMKREKQQWREWSASDSFQYKCAAKRGYKKSNRKSKLVRRLVEQLPERRQSVLSLRFEYDLSQSKTGVHLGVSTATVANDEHRALMHIRRNFKSL